MSSSQGGAVRGRSAGRRARRVLLVGALALTPVTASLAAVSVGAPAGAAGTPVIAETFENSNVSSPSSWVKPPGPESTANSACLTAGNDTSQTPIPDCSATGGDPDGSGVLQLTNASGVQEGGALTSLSVPASNGLDATFDSYQYGGDGADGIGFVIAAEDPSDPVAPAQIGQPGGDLGYSAGAGATGERRTRRRLSRCRTGRLRQLLQPQLRRHRVPRELFVGCHGHAQAGGRAGSWQRHRRILPPQQLGQRVPGDDAGPDGPGRSGSMVPVEVVLNTTSAAVNMSGAGFTSNQVPAGDYGVAWVPIGATSAEFYDGPLPSTTQRGLPSGLYPTS